MERIRGVLLFFLILLLAGCRGQTPLTDQTPQPEAPAALTQGPPSVHTTSVPDVRDAARAYLDGWKAGDYASMYALLTSVGQSGLSLDEFTTHYQGVAAEMALSGLDTEILSSLIMNPESAQVSYRLTFHSVLVGDFQRDTLMNLILEKGQWRVQWDDTLVLPELAGDNYLGMDREGYTPSRANIYDRNGHALVAQADATALGLYPDNILEEQADALFSNLSTLTGLRVDTIQNMYANFPAGGGWYLPLGEVPADEVARRFDVLSGLSGLVMESYKARYYFDGGIAPHVVGHVGTISEEEVQEYKQRGYRQDERVGKMGLEKWGEQYLSGQRGGALYVFDGQGRPVTRLAELQAEPSQAITTTLDRDFQLGVQETIASFRGAAVVVLERDTGRVLAMASSPGFDPNAFEPVNVNSYTLLQDIYSDPASPTLNRATQGQYPLGSVFKIITMAAALESGRFNPDTSYDCGYHFDELAGMQLHDWTWEHFQQDGETIPSGTLTLSQGLMRSCNPWFYHIGLDLYSNGLTKAMSDMARSFGLGEATGIEGVEEEAGNVQDPDSELDATNLAIGQGDLMVTPLQVANFVAAIGNGGKLYRPQVIEKIAPPDGDPTYAFEPVINGELPLEPETLQAIQDAMVGVIRNEKPRGTAWHRFTGLDVNVAGKTGTAQSGSGFPHAWFAGYTYEGRGDKADIAVSVIVENIGEGSDYAAPIFRRVVELYFTGQPQKLYWWESTYNVTATPTSEFDAEVIEETPTPEEVPVRE